MEVGLKRTAVLCILRSTAGLLLLRRSKQPHLGKYIPVGGKLEPFETPRSAALREIEEETKVKVGDVVFCGVMAETSPTPFNWVNFIYTAEIDPIDPADCEEGTLEWVPVSHVSDLPTPTTDRYIYEYVLRGATFMLDARYDKDLNLILLVDEVSRTRLFSAR